MTGSVVFAAGMGRNRQRPQTPPAFRVAATGQVNGGTTISTTIPVTAQVGDFAIAFHVLQEGCTSTPPAGWTALTSNLADRPSTVGAPALYVYTKTLVSGDINAAKTWTNSISTDGAVAIVVYSGVGGISVQPVWNINDNTIAAGYTHKHPCVKPGPYDLVVAAIACLPVTGIGANLGDPTVLPAGFTQRANNKGGNGGLVRPRAITVADGPSGDQSGKTWGFSGQHQYSDIMAMCLRPAVERTKDVEKFPPSLYGKPVHAYGASGHSFILGTSIYGGDTEHITDAIIHRRMMNASGRNANGKNMSMGGSFVADQCAMAFGTTGDKTEFDPNDTTHVNTRVMTWHSQTQDSVVMWDGLGNDALHDGDNSGADSALRRLGARNSLDSLIRLFRTYSRFNALSGGLFTYNGAGWATSASGGFMDGAAIATSTNGDNVTYTATIDHDIVLIGFDDASLGAAGSTYTITKNGVTIKSGTTSNQMKATGVRQNYKFTQLVIPVDNVNPAGEPIVITKTGATGGLMFNGLIFRSATPPVIMVAKLQHFDAATINAVYGAGVVNYSDAVFDTYSQIAQDVVDQFTDGRVLIYDPLASGKWNTATMIGYDAVHSKAEGHAHYANEQIMLLNAKFP